MTSDMKTLTFCVLLVAAMTATAGAQTPVAPVAAPTPGAPGSAVPSTSGKASDYQVGPGDVLSISVSGLREFEQSTRVSNSGRIRVPYIGVMFVAGMTTFEIESDVARLIKEHELVNEPTVRVLLSQRRARPVYVVGEVTTPGQYVITGDMYLVDLVSKAGGLGAGADDVGYLYRRARREPSVQARLVDVGPDAPARVPVASKAATPPVPEAAVSGTVPASPVPQAGGEEGDVIKIDVAGLKQGTRPEMNIRLEGGDVLYVPRRVPQNFYVIGDVSVPGAYDLPRDVDLTAAQAIVYAGGTLPQAKTGKAFLMRYDAQGRREAIPVDFKAILAGKQGDIPIKKDDIIFVPSSPVKAIGIGLLDMLPTLLQQWLIF